jgi:hypothetical protein
MMRATEREPSRVTLERRAVVPSRPAPPPPSTATSTEEEGFDAITGALLSIAISVPLWVLIAIIVVLLRR